MRIPVYITLLLCAVASTTRARANEVSRVLSTFDFEERRLGNPEEIPMYWEKLEGEGFPHYVNARLTTDRPRSGKYSFCFELNGGSLQYRYPAGRIPVRPGTHYRVEGFCRTTAMPAARARLTAYLADVDGQVLDGTVSHSELYAAAPGKEGDTWKRLAVEIAASDSAAAYLVLELGLLQPAHYADKLLGERTLHDQDIRGTAWFDDLSVAQVPQVALSTTRPGNVFRRSDPLQLQARVSDPFTGDLAAQLVVRDAVGRTVFQRSGALDLSAAETAPGVKQMGLDLPELPPGWYEAVLLTTSGGQFLGQHTIQLVRLPDDAPAVRPDERFGLIATDLPSDGWADLPDVLPMLAAGRVKLAVWSRAGDMRDADPAAFDHLLQRLGELGIKPTGCLLELPPALAAKVDGADWTRILTSPADGWQPPLAYLVARHASRLERWQLGADGTDRFVTDPAMRRAFDRVYDEFRALMRDPDLAMPWPAWYDLEGDLPATIALSVPPSVLPSQLPLYVSDVNREAGEAGEGGLRRNLSLSLELLDRARYGRDAQVRDLAQRVIYALSAGAGRIDVPLPFTAARDADAVVKQPQEMLLIVRTLLTTLSGAKYLGRVPLADGVEAFLFDRDGRGVLALWDRGSERGVKRLALNLGPRAASVDLWGNVTPLLRTPGDRGKGEVLVEVGPTPQFLVDIDGRQAQLRASVALDRPLIESSFTSHPRRLTFTNPYRTPIGGTLRLKPPAGWTLNPPTFTFTLNPGEQFDRELTIEFPYNSYAGPKTINAEFSLGAGHDGGSTFTVPITLNLGLSDVGMQTLALRDGADVVVQQMISNYGSKPIDYTAFAVFPGQARQERLVTGLAPGRTTVKRYRFKGATVTPGLSVRSGVKEQEGTRILNEAVEVQ